MKDSVSNAFDNIPWSTRNHFLLNFYAAVYRLINHISRLSEVGGDDLKTIFERYPFLEGYFLELRQYMPEKITWEKALIWWEREITAWEKSCNEHLPLLSLFENGVEDFHKRIAFMVVGLIEEDSRFGTIFAKLQEPLAKRRPCLELVGRIMIDEGTFGDTDPLSICSPLLSTGLIDVINNEEPRPEWVLRVPSILWDIVRGEMTSHPAPWCQYHPSQSFPSIEELIFPEKFLGQLKQIPALVMGGKADAIILRGMKGSERLRIIGALAKSLDRCIVAVDNPASLTEQQWRLLVPLCLMTYSLPVITYDMGPGETVKLPAFVDYNGPLGILMGFEGGLRGRDVEKAVTLQIPTLKNNYRIRYWQEALSGYHIENLHEISERFHMPGGFIRQAASMAIAHAALNRRETVHQEDIREACRALNHQMLDTLASRLEVEGSWDHIVVSDSTTAKLKELERRCHHRERILCHLGPGFGSDCNHGVRALFTGPSGTGKTLAAKILAAVLGIDLYRVDLAAVVNKYIGETEKNLHRVLSTAEELDILLLLDEGDALLGRRTAVKSANDRYANLETNYLLQRLENYQGIVVITTNLGEGIDSAFQRRMDVVVNFIRPQAQERWNIWQLHLPENHAIDDKYLEDVAVRCALTGGQIRNAILQATLLALDNDSGIIKDWHLKEAIQSEYRKAGAICPMNGKGNESQKNNGMESFLDAISS